MAKKKPRAPARKKAATKPATRARPSPRLLRGIEEAKQARQKQDPKGLLTAIHSMLDAGLPLVEDDERYGLLHDWTFWIWDLFGYSDPAPVKIWTAYYRWKLDKKKPVDATKGMALVAWHQAIRGVGEDVHALLDLWREQVAPKDPKGATETILFDAAFSAGVWAEDADLARAGLDAFLEFYRLGANHLPEENSQFLRCAVRSAMLFGWSDALERWWQPYSDAIANEYGKHGPMEKLRKKALVALRKGSVEEAREYFRELTEYAHRVKVGPEWVAEGSVEAARMSALLGSRNDAISDLKWAHEVMDRYGVITFERPIRLLYERLP